MQWQRRQRWGRQRRQRRAVSVAGEEKQRSTVSERRVPSLGVQIKSGGYNSKRTGDPTAAEEGGPRAGGELEAGSDCGSEAAVVAQQGRLSDVVPPFGRDLRQRRQLLRMAVIDVERSRQLGKRIDAGGENRSQIGDAGWIGGAAESSASTEEARMIGLHSGVGYFSNGAMEELPWVDELGSSRLSLWPCEIADEGSATGKNHSGSEDGGMRLHDEAWVCA
ncbi:hypothetical protein M0R45_012881 [Rubus argutus]|uniref:Uncharacterized protein n=1 Tax=Rubus argutus TaxID=59490 RepID=A0AAW1XGJ1_RUBAR